MDNGSKMQAVQLNKRANETVLIKQCQAELYYTTEQQLADTQFSDCYFT